MKLLLDTHAFLWWIMDDPKLSPQAADAIQGSDNDIYVSVASAWEIAIKAGLGKLKLPDTPKRFVPRQLAANNFLVLPINLDHGLAVQDLPLHHRDPFDRLLVTQSQIEKMPIVTDDGLIKRYGVKVLW